MLLLSLGWLQILLFLSDGWLLSISIWLSHSYVKFSMSKIGPITHCPMQKPSCLPWCLLTSYPILRFSYYNCWSISLVHMLFLSLYCNLGEARIISFLNCCNRFLIGLSTFGWFFFQRNISDIQMWRPGHLLKTFCHMLSLLSFG